MRENKILIYIVAVLCAIWLCVSLKFVNIRHFNIYMADLIVNPIGIIIILYATKDNQTFSNLKWLLSVYFLAYGIIFLVYDIYFIISHGDIHSLDTFYFISDMTMIYLPIKLYKISISEILKRLKR